MTMMMMMMMMLLLLMKMMKLLLLNMDLTYYCSWQLEKEMAAEIVAVVVYIAEKVAVVAVVDKFVEKEQNYY